MFGNKRIERLEKYVRVLNGQCSRLSNNLFGARANIGQLKIDNEKHVELSASMTATVERMSKLFVHSGITEKSVCENILKKLGPKWSLRHLPEYNIAENSTWWLAHDHSTFKVGGSPWEVLEYALERREEAKKFCAQPKKKSKKGGK